MDQFDELYGKKAFLVQISDHGQELLDCLIAAQHSLITSGELTDKDTYQVGEFSFDPETLAPEKFILSNDKEEMAASWQDQSDQKNVFQLNISSKFTVDPETHMIERTLTKAKQQEEENMNTPMVLIQKSKPKPEILLQSPIYFEGDTRNSYADAQQAEQQEQKPKEIPEDVKALMNREMVVYEQVMLEDAPPKEEYSGDEESGEAQQEMTYEDQDEDMFGMDLNKHWKREKQLQRKKPYKIKRVTLPEHVLIEKIILLLEKNPGGLKKKEILMEIDNPENSLMKVVQKICCFDSKEKKFTLKPEFQ